MHEYVTDVFPSNFMRLVQLLWKALRVTLPVPCPAGKEEEDELEVRRSSDDSLGIASCDALGLMLFNPTEIPKSSAKVRNILKVFTETTLQFHTCFNGFVTFAILG